MAADNVFKIILDVEHKEELKNLQKGFDAAEKSLKNLIKSGNQYSAVGRKFATELGETHKKIEKLEKLTKKGIFGGKEGGRSILLLSQGLEDMQYGFSAIVNNIPGFVMAVGGSAGLAGAVSIAAVAVNVLVEHWGTLVNVFKSAWSSAPLAELEKIRLKTEQVEKAFEDLIKAPKTADVAVVKKLSEIYEEFGAERVQKSVREAIMNDPGQKLILSPAEQKAMDDANAHKANAAFELSQVNKGNDRGGAQMRANKELEKAEELMKPLNDRIAAAIAEEVKKVMGGATIPGEGGKKGRDELRRLIHDQPKAFGAELARALLMNETKADRRKEADRREKIFEGMDKGVAAQAMQGPLGMQMMMDQVMAAGPARAAVARVTKAQVLKEALKDDLQKMVGLTPAEDAALRGGRIQPGQFGAIQEKMAGPLAAARKRLEQQARDRAAAQPDPMEARIKAQMDAAGVMGDPKGVLRQMRDMNEARVQGLMLERGLTKQQAQRVLAEEGLKRLNPNLYAPSQYVGLAEFAKMQPQTNEVERQQLLTQQEMVGFLRTIAAQRFQAVAK